MSTPTLELDPAADDQKLLASVVAYYHETLRNTPDALSYLARRGLTNPAMLDHFRLGFSDRSLGLKLPIKQLKAGDAIRTRLAHLGLYRSSGHEHFRGSITIPITAADGSGSITDIFGKKIQKALRKGTPIDTHLNDKKLGIWNIEAFGPTDEIVLAGSMFDALTFWNHGYRNVTTSFGTVTDDLRSACREFGIRRVITPCDTLVPQLLSAGIEVFTIKLPPGQDVNRYCREVADPADALGSLLRAAGWEGRGVVTASVCNALPDEVDDDADEEADDEEEPAQEVPDGQEEPSTSTVIEPPPEPPIRTASPVPSPPIGPQVEVTDEEVVMTIGTRRYRVRGLVNNSSLDQLRINLLASNGVGMFLDSFDFYSAKHRKSFVEQAAVELNVEERTIKADLGRLLLVLEEQQDHRLQAAVPKVSNHDMTPADREAAMSLLRDPGLLDRVAADLPVVGERTNKLVGYLAAVSRKLDRPLAIVIQSTSAAGKTALMEAVLSFCPPEDVVKFSAMTGQSLYYMADGNLKNKILAIVEEEGASRASYALKLLQSEGELRIASTGKDAGTGRLTTQEYRVEGPTMLFLTTTSIQVDEELLNRCLVLSVCEDREQTQAIHRQQRQRETLEGQLSARSRDATRELHRNVQRLLRPLLVVNPFAERLTYMDSQTRTRRDHQKYLALIRTIALLRQHQRPIRTAEHDGQPIEYIEVTLEDIEEANRLAANVLGRSLDSLPPQTRRLLDLLDQMVRAACDRDGLDRADFRFSMRDAQDFTAWGSTQLKLHLRRLAEAEYLYCRRDRDTRRLLYELAYCPGCHDRATPGLIDVEQLRRGQ